MFCKKISDMIPGVGLPIGIIIIIIIIIIDAWKNDYSRGSIFLKLETW